MTEILDSIVSFSLTFPSYLYCNWKIVKFYFKIKVIQTNV